MGKEQAKAKRSPMTAADFAKRDDTAVYARC